MRTILLILSTLLIMTEAPAQFAQKRMVLVFGEPKSSIVVAQMELFAKDAAGLRERDMEVKQVAPGDKKFKQYKVGSSQAFVLVLVGKDGGEKYRSEKLTTPVELFTIVDAMPMRQSEMRRQKLRR